MENNNNRFSVMLLEKDVLEYHNYKNISDMLIYSQVFSKKHHA